MDELILLLTGCGDEEYLMRHEFELKKRPVLLYMVLEDYRELQAIDPETWKLKKGELPIKATYYIVPSTEIIKQEIYERYGLEDLDAVVISMLYSEYGAFLELYLQPDEFEDIESAENFIIGQKENIQALLQNIEMSEPDINQFADISENFKELL